jgi:hypothetical protein
MVRLAAFGMAARLGLTKRVKGAAETFDQRVAELWEARSRWSLS